MNVETRVLAVASTLDDLKWLSRYELSLQESGIALMCSDAQSVPSDCDPQVIVLDETLGQHFILNYLVNLSTISPSISILLAVGDANIKAFAPLIRHGAQDILLKDTDTSAAVQRSVACALNRVSVLSATERSEGQLRLLMEALSDGLIVLDESNVVLYVNTMTEHLLGLPIQDLIGTKCPIAISGSGPEFVTWQQPDEEARTLSVQVSPILWEHHDANILLLRDVTEEQASYEWLMSARKAAEEAGKMKSAFLANMSHELRIPLASIIGFAQLIEEGEVKPEHREFAQIIQQSGHRLLDTINAVLEAARLEQHQIIPVPERLDLSAIISDAAKRLQPLVRQPDVSLTLSGPESLFVRADLGFTERILYNLIGNAAKFTSSGRIDITWEADADQAVVHITDTGIGINDSFLKSAFEPFTQESSGPGRTHDGSGLGLSIVKNLVENMGGTISVQSVKNEGSTFTFTLPLAKTPPLE
jgi:signal transduction histidine kinase